MLAALCLAGFGVSSATAAETYTESPGTEGDGDHTVGPDYEIDPDLTDRGNPKGRSFEFSTPLADSKIFRGDDATLLPAQKQVRKERKIFVYVPAAYKDSDKAPILVTHDGPSRLVLVRNALDNLTISKDPKRKLPAFEFPDNSFVDITDQKLWHVDTVLALPSNVKSATRFDQPDGRDRGERQDIPLRI